MGFPCCSPFSPPLPSAPKPPCSYTSHLTTARPESGEAVAQVPASPRAACSMNSS